MISMLRGRLVDQEGNEATLEVKDVGYCVLSPRRSIARWKGASSVKIFVVTEVRQTQIHLYGFENADEKRMFRMLRDAAGLDSRVSLAVLDSMDADELRLVVQKQDTYALQRVPGIGMELARSVIRALQFGLPSAPTTEETPDAESGEFFMPDEDDNTVIVAMARMGYRRNEIEKVQKNLDKKVDAKAPIADRLKAALGILHGGD